MQRLSVTVILVSLLIFPGVVVFAQEGATSVDVSSTTGIIRGQVLDTTAQSSPVTQVEVIVRGATDEQEYTTKSDESGEFELSGVPPGRFLMSFYRDGYKSREGKPVTLAAGGDQYVQMKMTKKDDIFSFFAKFGIIFWPLALCSVVAVTFIIERLFTFTRSRSKIGTEQFMASITNFLRNENIMEAVSTCEEAGGPLANVLKAGLLKFSQAQIEERQISKEEIQEAIQEAGLLEIPELERNLPVLGTIASISPLFGLLGTVIGMISAFTTIALEGTGDPQQLAGGISQALLTTAGGLTIAIPCLIFYNLFDSWVNRYVIEIEQVSNEIVNQLVLGQIK
jgi:biopolymer transport protein ExbB